MPADLRERFETERRRTAFLSFLAGAGIGIIVFDTWVSHWLGIPGGLAVGALAYGVTYGYDTLMWRRRHGR
ncbi:MAG: hypothetical protein KatS3mg063_2647 [Tepidiforma sp.]|jgi:hypothetical protein|uniref:hypothetical protein n=1 Tax=Tepidiforma sp. TaxID=2682230 RepID=UPI0021DDB051|nr:hypothetical protein [Tepidiforma sp.]GIW16794.1 MAG: hypothetical protein KatS3mg063_2647 [Tepidiforma sp.]